MASYSSCEYEVTTYNSWEFTMLRTTILNATWKKPQKKPQQKRVPMWLEREDMTVQLNYGGKW